MRRLLCLSVLLTSSALAQGSQTFSLVQGRSAVLFQWTAAGGQLSGSAQVVTLNPDLEGINLVVTNATLTGTVNGAAHAFALSSPLIAPGVTALSGTLSGKTLNLQYPLSTGGFGSLTLNTTTVNAFTGEVNRLKAEAAQAVTTLRQQDAQQQVADETTRLTGELAFTLADAERLTDELNLAAPALAESVTAAQATLSAAQKALVTATDAADRCDGFVEALAAGETAIQDVRLAAENLRTERQFVSELTVNVQTNLTGYTRALQALQGRVPAAELQRLTADGAPTLTLAKTALSGASPILGTAEAQAGTNLAAVTGLKQALGVLHC